MVKIKDITPRSIAEKAGIPAGELLSINGFEINDFLDYDYYNKEKKLTIKVRTDKIYTYSITKREYDDIGLIFDSFLMDEVKSCRNKCIFCFIDQNPPGMREAIYFKDDDSRMSFIAGNYITLTNLTEKDVARIIKMKLPVNVSLHTMNPELRVKMMGNRFAGDCIDSLRRIAAAGNKVNIQLVLCRGINDGDELRFTLEELYNLGNIYAIAAVPVGLTKHRDGLFPLTPFDKDSSQAVIDIIEEFAEKFAARDERENGYPEDACGRIPGRRSVYASDEFFLKAGQPIPDKNYYDDFPQYQNGVGFVRAFTDEFLYELRRNIYERKNYRGEKYILITGESSFESVRSLVAYAKNFYNINTTVLAVKNNFYGGGVNVTGLLTGGDIISALSGKNLSGTLLLIDDMFKKDTELFLDNKTRGDVEEALKLPCEIIRRDGTEVLRKIAGI